ncbi:MAG TPA: PEP-CTERM sorting domain-containing protein [Nitrosomonas sp.]|nr:PEP-CTERM sorting domain-containing protein [Nitrosomonas sp.]
MYSIRQLTVLMFLIILPLPASAVMLEQAPLDGGDGSLSVGPSGIQIATDDFQFANTVLLTNIRWWGSYDPAAPVTESLTVRLFADDGSGNPETNAFFETTFAGNGDGSGGLTDLFGGAVFQYDLGVNQLLQGGADYYLSVFNNDGAQDWYWLESSAGNNTGWSRAADGDAWNFDAAALNMSFQLTGVIPEPATLLLMALPLLWFVGLVRRRSDSLS